MKKKLYVIVFVLLTIALALVCSCSLFPSEESEQQLREGNTPWIEDAYIGTQGVLSLDKLNLTPNSRLVVCGQKIDGDIPMYFNKDPIYVLLPFTLVLETMGAEVCWINDTEADILFKGRKYRLDLSAATSAELIVDVESGKKFSFLVPGASVRFQAIETELLLDEMSTMAALEQMDVHIVTRISFWNTTLRIIEKY